MLRKIKSGYKFQVRIPLGIVVAGIILILLELPTYIKYKNANPIFDNIESIGTKEFGYIISFGFVIAILFKNNFKFFMAVGASRKSIFTSNILTCISTAPMIALINVAIYKAFHNYQKFDCLFLSIFKGRYENNTLSEKTILLEYFIWQVTAFLMVSLFVYLVMLLLYRLNKKGIIICISLIDITPIILIIFMGIYKGTDSLVLTNIIDTIKYVFGDRQYPMLASLTNIILATIFGFIGYRILRRTPLK